MLNRAVLVAGFMLAGLLVTCSPLSAAPTDPQQAELQSLWKEMLNASVSDPAKAKALMARMQELAPRVPPEKRLECILSMMEVEIPDSVTPSPAMKQMLRSSAMAPFGSDPIPAEDIRKLLAADELDANRDALLCAYYNFMRTGWTKGPLTPAGAQAMVALLSQELNASAGKTLSAAKRERLAALAVSALNSSRELDALWKAMEAYQAKAAKDDLLALHIAGWQEVRNLKTDDKSWQQAVVKLAHWSEDARRSAGQRLGTEVRNQDNHQAVLQVIETSLSDPRPEVREAAVMACQWSGAPLPQTIIEKLLQMLKSDKPEDRIYVMSTLSHHVKDPGADKALPVILDILARPVHQGRELGETWGALVGFVEIMTPDQKRQLCQQAIKDLPEEPYAVLDFLQALGPDAAPARTALEDFTKSTKDQFLVEKVQNILKSLPPK